MQMHPGSTPRARLLSRRSQIVSKIAALAIVAAAPGCATMEKAIVAEPGVAFSLPLGQTATLRGSSARITFAQVREDSRCPVDVTCVWAGDAKIELTVSTNGSGNDVRVLSLTPPNNETSSGDLRIRLVGLTPAPRQSDGNTPRAYVAQLVVTRG